MSVCTKCQHLNLSGVQFCDECGDLLSPPAAEPAPPIPQGDGSPARYMAKLVVSRGGSVGKEFPVESMGETHVGRWDPDGGSFPEIDLTLDDPEAKVSRRHARLFVQEGEYYVEDLGSLNGSFLNRGPRLLPGGGERIKDGDELILGKTFFKFAAI